MTYDSLKDYRGEQQPLVLQFSIIVILGTSPNRISSMWWSLSLRFCVWFDDERILMRRTIPMINISMKFRRKMLEWFRGVVKLHCCGGGGDARGGR